MGYYDLFEEEFGDGDIPEVDDFRSRFDDDLGGYAEPFQESGQDGQDGE